MSHTQATFIEKKGTVDWGERLQDEEKIIGRPR